jgi:integrase
MGAVQSGGQGILDEACDRRHGGADARLALKLLLVTAQRHGELTFAKWAHFDLDGKLWTIPAELLKSSHARRPEPEPHLVPLSPLALKLLEELKALTGEGTYVLP